jgi:hypothetical protein
LTWLDSGFARFFERRGLLETTDGEAPHQYGRLLPDGGAMGESRPATSQQPWIQQKRRHG